MRFEVIVSAENESEICFLIAHEIARQKSRILVNPISDLVKAILIF